MKNNNKKWIILFFLVLGLSSCKTNTPIKKTPKNGFLGVYCMDINTITSKKFVSYSVEFKKDMSARVIIFTKNKKRPIIYHGKYLFSKNNKDIIILYFPKNVPSEFLLNNHDGTLSILDDNQNIYKGKKGKALVLKKIN